MEKTTVQEESFWEDLILLETIKDDSGDTSGAAEFLDDVRERREKRRATRLRRTLRNANKQTATLVPPSSSPPPEMPSTSRESGKVPNKFPKAEAIVEQKPKTPERMTSKADIEKGVVRVVKQPKVARPPTQARKRKRAPSVELVAKGLRVFDGLRFCQYFSAIYVDFC